MVSIRLKLNTTVVEDWLADFSTEFPDAEFKVLTDQATDDGLLGIVEVTTSDRSTLVDQFEDTSKVRSHEVLQTNEQQALIQFMIPMSESYEILHASRNLPEYPVILQDGWFSFTVTASQEQLSTYTGELAAADIPYQILSLSQSRESSELLTDRQWHFVTEAVERGYYDIPRVCTIAELAEGFDINKSSASRLLRRAESRIIAKFVTEATA